MTIGDVGGPNSTFIITCEADRAMRKGDPVALLEDYRVTNRPTLLTKLPLFGQVAGHYRDDIKRNDQVPIIVSGVCRFKVFSERRPGIGNYAFLQVHKDLPHVVEVFRYEPGIDPRSYLILRWIRKERQTILEVLL